MSIGRVDVTIFLRYFVIIFYEDTLEERKKSYICKLIMKRAFNIVIFAALALVVSCGGGGAFSGDSADEYVVATVDAKELLLSDIISDMPEGLVGVDSATFVRMYTDNWVLNQLKLQRAKEVLASHDDIEELVEDYRQSLIMRQLDQYYVDQNINTDITERQIAAHYRLHSSQFKLDHDEVRGVIVRVREEFRNVAALKDAMRNVSSGDIAELGAFVEKHSLQITDLSSSWVTYSDFLSYLPTVRTRSYDNLLQRGAVQSMTSEDIVFYFVITDIARKGSVAPLESVEDDIRRMLYSERRSEIVNCYEQELKYEGVESGRVKIEDEVLLQSIGCRPQIKSAEISVGEVSDEVQEEDVTLARE